MVPITLLVSSAKALTSHESSSSSGLHIGEELGFGEGRLLLLGGFWVMDGVKRAMFSGGAMVVQLTFKI